MEATDSDGAPSFKITTPSATYYYQKQAGGFSSMLDVKNRDWIAYATSDSVTVPKSSDSDFRGYPIWCTNLMTVVWVILALIRQPQYYWG